MKPLTKYELQSSYNEENVLFFVGHPVFRKKFKFFLNSVKIIFSLENIIGWVECCTNETQIFCKKSPNIFIYHQWFTFFNLHIWEYNMVITENRKHSLNIQPTLTIKSVVRTVYYWVMKIIFYKILAWLRVLWKNKDF